MGTRILLLAALSATAAMALVRGKVHESRTTARAPRPQLELPNPSEAADEASGAEGTPSAEGMRVVDDATGEPVPGARITFYRADWSTRTVEARATVLSDEAGRFEPAEGFPVYLLVIEAPGYPLTPFDLDEKERELRLGRGTTRTIAIVDEEGMPCPGAQVDVYGDYGQLLRLYTAEPDAQGNATLWLSGHESLLVRMQGCGYEDVDGTEVVLRPGYSIGGRVVDSAGRPVAGARVDIWQGSG